MNNTLGAPAPSTELNEIPREIDHLAIGIDCQHNLLSDLEARLASVLVPIVKSASTNQPPQAAPTNSSLGNDIMIQRGRVISTNDRLIALLNALAL